MGRSLQLLIVRWEVNPANKTPLPLS